MGKPHQTTGLCRDCGTAVYEDSDRCPECHSRRLIFHPELFDLSIAHVDCDAFFAAVEKRDNPALRDKPVLIGGGKRGVVATACYIARMSGVRSAMPMFKATKLCPDAVIIRGNMQKYKQAGQQIRNLFKELTPLVEPLSIDEAFLDLSGTRLYHKGKSAAHLMTELARKIEAEVGISVSVGLASNKFLAKLASDMDKPRGFTVIGHHDAKSILAALPINRIYGIGKATEQSLAKQGLTQISQLQTMDQKELVHKFGDIGLRLYRLSRGIDHRSVKTNYPTKSISSETTFQRDIKSYEELEDILWRQVEKLSQDMKTKGFGAKTITLKLKTSAHKSMTRSHTVENPVQLANSLFDIGKHLLKPMANGTYYRLLGIGGSQLCTAELADPDDLIDPLRNKINKAEKAMDALKGKFGHETIQKGRSLKIKNQ